MRSIGSLSTRIIKRAWVQMARVLRLEARRPLVPAGLALPARWGLGLLLVLLLELYALLAAPRPQPAPVAVAEFLLRSDPSFSNLNNTSAEASARPPAPPVVFELGSRETAQGAAPAPAPLAVRLPLHDIGPSEFVTADVPERLPLPRPEPVVPPAEFPRTLAAGEMPPILPAAVLEPVREDCYSARDLHLGDTPMMRTWKQLGLNALLATLFAAAPSLGSGPSSSTKDSEKLSEIQTRLDDLRRALTALEDRLKEARSEAASGGQKVQNQIKELNDQLSLLRLDVETLRRQPPASRSSAYPPSSDTGPTPALARVEMINTYPQPVSIVINNRRSYLLAPGERRLSEPIPAGAFTYEVLGIQPSVTRLVTPERPFTVWVHPQP